MHDVILHAFNWLYTDVAARTRDMRARSTFFRFEICRCKPLAFLQTSL